MKEFYESDEDFREYVDRYCFSRGVSVDVALTHLQVKIVAEWYGWRDEV